jgi:CheY-like chemotaxis protein
VGKKILLADDSITIQKVIELTFSDEDFEVVTVGNGRLAIERLPEAQPDLVLCDIIMPEKDGYEVCDFIKKSPSLSHIPVLLLTGAFEPFDQERASRVGCDGFLAKPFEPQTLIAKVKDLLAKAGPKSSTTGGMRTIPPSPPPAASAPTPTAVPPPAAPPAPPSPWSAAPSPPPWSAPPPPPPVAAPVFEPEADEPEAVEEERDFPTMVSKPGSHGEPSMFEDTPYGAGAVVPPPELTPVTPEEAASLGGDRGEDEGPSTVMFQPGRAPWSQQTIEVPLEMRAQAGVAAQAEPEPLFEEVFDAEPTPPAPPRPAAAPPSVPAPAASSMSDEADEVFVESAEDEGAPWSASRPTATAAASTSFADVSPASTPAPAAPASQAAEVPVPADMVEKIAQRVVAQISEKVVREVAWEVIPDLAEALIKKEIERLKDELQRT